VLLNESFEFDTENPFAGSFTVTRTLQKRITHKYVKHCLDFSFVFSAPLPAEESCTQQAGSFAVEGTSHVVPGSSDQRKVQASPSLFLKSEKIPALRYVGKGPEYMPFREFRPAPLAYRPRARILNH
jgi:hypothetical protein